MRGASLGLAAVACLLALSASPATGHPKACAFPRAQPPLGDPGRVYEIPHGCVRLALPRDQATLPSIVVRQHDRRGRIITRRFPLPDSNLDRAYGSVGICGRDSTYVFFVAYPFVTVVAQELYELDGRRQCATDVDRALLWAGRLSPLPSLRMTWWTHRGSR